MKVLITAFEPFGGENVNAVGALLDALPDTLEGVALVREVLPVTFLGAAARLRELLDVQRPDAVLCLGQAAGRASLSLERVAINMAHSGADNAGDAPCHRRLVEDAPDGYFARLPLDAILEASRAAGVPMALSNTAGTYVCNCAMFTLLDAMARGASPRLGGFIHVPSTPAQVVSSGLPSMDTATACKGIMAALGVVCRTLKEAEA